MRIRRIRIDGRLPPTSPPTVTVIEQCCLFNGSHHNTRWVIKSEFYSTAAGAGWWLDGWRLPLHYMHDDRLNYCIYSHVASLRNSADGTTLLCGTVSH